MPAKSDKQQTAARIAHAIKKGKVKPKAGTASAQMAKGMSDKQIKHFMVKEEDGGTTSVNIGPGPATVPSKKKSNLPPAFLANIKKKKAEKEKEQKEEAAALERVMQMVYAEEANLREAETEGEVETHPCAGCKSGLAVAGERFCSDCQQRRDRERRENPPKAPTRGYWNKEKWYPRR